MNRRLWLAATALTACATTDDMPPELLGTLDRVSTCDDAMVVVANAADDLALVVAIDGLLEQALEIGDVLQHRFALDRHRDLVTLYEGEALSAGICAGAPDAHRVMRGVSGEVRVNVTPQGRADDGSPIGVLDVTLDRVDFVDVALGPDSRAYVYRLDLDAFVDPGAVRHGEIRALEP